MDKMNNTLASVFSVMMAIITVLGICAPAIAEAQSGELTVWLLTDEPEFFDQMFADFSTAHPEIKAKWVGHSIDGHKEALRQVINTEAAPDIYYMYGASGPGLGGFYIAAGGTEPIDKYYEQYRWKERFNPASLAASTVDGKLWAVPFRVRTMGLFYSKKAFEKAGITAEPTTYEELVAANQKLVEAGITPLAMGGKFSWMSMRLLDSLLEMECGAQTHDDLKNLKVNWTKTACATKGFQEFRRWIDEGWLPKDFLGVQPEDTHAPVYKGEAAMYYEGDWVVPRLNDEGMSPDDMGFFHFPTGTGRISYFTEELFISRTSTHKDAAAVFLDWLSSKPVQEMYAGKFGSLPPTKNSPVPEDAPVLLKEVIDLVDKAPGIYIPGDQSLPYPVVLEYWRAQDGIIAKLVKPEEAPQIVQTAIDKFLAK